jgi:hypothetical protein
MLQQIRVHMHGNSEMKPSVIYWINPTKASTSLSPSPYGWSSYTVELEYISKLAEIQHGISRIDSLYWIPLTAAEYSSVWLVLMWSVCFSVVEIWVRKYIKLTILWSYRISDSVKNNLNVIGLYLTAKLLSYRAAINLSLL